MNNANNNEYIINNKFIIFFSFLYNSIIIKLDINAIPFRIDARINPMDWLSGPVDWKVARIKKLLSGIVINKYKKYRIHIGNAIIVKSKLELGILTVYLKDVVETNNFTID